MYCNCADRTALAFALSVLYFLGFCTDCAAKNAA
jgi:hypothetical protein